MWIERDLEGALRSAAAQRPVVVLTGPRQAGKTSLLRHAFPGYNFVSLDLPSEAAGSPFNAYWPLCVAAGVTFAALAGYAQIPGLVPPPPPAAAGAPSPGNLSVVGTALFTQFALPFEIASLILLAAIVGAVVVAKRKTES
jgi:hypothetical protein